MEAETKKETVPRQYITAEGEVVMDLPGFAANPRDLTAQYRAMLLTRILDEKAVALQRTGRLGTYPSSLGQEAVGVGTAAAMNDSDVLLPSFREQSAMLWRGVSLLEILLYWGGDETGNNFVMARNDFPICVPVGSHFPHAAGVGFGLKHRGIKGAAVVIAGDGATSKGDFYESINLAGVWRLPVVYVINNNQWAISVSREKQTAAKTLADKAVAAGIPGVRVDGNDVVAMQQVIAEALVAAKDHQQPTLVEAVTYRLSDHTTADDASRYRTDEEVSAHWALEPVRRLRGFLEQHAGWSRAEEEALLTEITTEVDKAVELYLASGVQEIASAFDFLYSDLPPALKSQRAEAVDRQEYDG